MLLTLYNNNAQQQDYPLSILESRNLDRAATISRIVRPVKESTNVLSVLDSIRHAFSVYHNQLQECQQSHIQ